MEKKFTQGKWYINGQRSILSNIQDEGDIVCLSPERWDASMENWDSNAKLIAAAPDLLEALEDLYNAIDSCVDLTPEILRKAQLAIKKALE